jgi:FAD/FMN-containing dehydrogenase
VSVTDERPQWSNWAGNQSCRPQEIAFPRTEDEVSEIIASATRRGLPIRVVGAGHSFSPICVTDGVQISLDRMSGIVHADPDSKLVRVRPGTRIREFGDPLWTMGLCLKNQGDIDSQNIAGAMSTATHGSGIGQQCFSATARRFRVVLPSGEAIEVSEDDPDLLAAVQVSLGLLGVITEVELEARDDEMAGRRHFSFFWMPAADSRTGSSWNTQTGST